MFEEYLEETEYVDYSDDGIKNLAYSLKAKSKDEIELIQKSYQYVRDVVKHFAYA